MTTQLGTAPAPASGAVIAARTTRWLDYLTVGAIALVVMLVSIPRLRAFALRENELDAMRMLRALATHPAPTGVDPSRMDLAAVVAHDAALKRRLEDLEFVDGGRLRRHGYLFDRAVGPSGEPMLRAWPWAHGQTGRGAFVWTPQRGLLGCANEDGRFSGDGGAPEAGDVDKTWLALPRTR